jgi:glycosyltransferase involved in cell wall biosynthesis
MKSILVLASTYPRWKGDTEPLFVHYLCEQLTSEYRVIALVPHYPGADRKENMDGVLVHRFRYFLPSGERLAYDGGIMQNLKKDRLKLLLVPFFLISQFIHILVLCRKYKISVIHAHWVIPQGLLALMARPVIPGKIKILSTSHGGDLFSLQSGGLQALKRFVFRRSDCVTVVSTAMREHLKQVGCNTSNISVQPMGVDLTGRFVPGTLPKRPNSLVYVGRLVEKKGVATLVTAIHLLKTDFPGLHLTIVGDGPEKAALEKLAAELGAGAHIDFAGSQPNEIVPQYYQSAGIAVVPSVIAADGDQEGLGLVAVEALGCGCVTIVSDLPALRDVVSDGENGLVFRATIASDLAEKIRHLLEDESLYNRLASAGRQSVIDRFDWQQVGARYRSIIDQCLE